ncbi:hypothetical protein [Ideonella sp. YS5]|uniref:hypothetical protein n=1 Tax=Ideonella sp. YS5 TaxID=3453714 RepID=UPI003EEBDF06
MDPDKRLHKPQADPAEDPAMQDERLLRIHPRPDGYHWTDAGQRQEFGPYESMEDALAAMDDSEQAVDQAIEQAELTDEAEQGLEIESQVDRGQEDEAEGAT